MFSTIANLVSFFHRVHWHNGVKAAEPAKQRGEALSEDAGEAEDVEEEEAGEHVKEN